jgi:hypothetical protein
MRRNGISEQLGLCLQLIYIRGVNFTQQLGQDPRIRQMVMNDACDRRLKSRRREALGIRMLLALAGHQAPRDVISESLDILRTVTGRQAITGLIKEIAGER